MVARATQRGLPQYLNYARPVAPGVIENKDGAFLTAFEYTGPDQEYEEHSRMAYLADQVNQDLVHFGNGWMLESHAARTPIYLPPAVHHCPDPTSALITEERGRRYAAEGTHYETRHVLTLTYLPPAAVHRHFSDYFFSNGTRKTHQQSRQALLRLFLADTEQFATALRRFFILRRLEDDELRHFLRFCVTGDDRPVGAPSGGEHLDYAIGSVPVSPHGGRAAGLHVRAVGVIGFPDEGTHPQMFADILHLPFSLRMSHRFIFLSTQTAVKDLNKKRADFLQLNAYNPKRVFWSLFQHVLAVDPTDRNVVAHNTDAEQQQESVERAITEIQGGRVRGGYYTMTVILHDRDPERVQRNALEVVAKINALGFTATIETDHAADVIGGSWPGHGTRNVRKPRLTTRHFAQLWPTSTTWRGEKVHPCSYYPPQSGPLLVTTTTGSTPFFLNTHVRNLGNFGVIGPSGYGKTYVLNAIAIAHRQYERAQINFFDRDAGAMVPTLACGGEFFDIDAMHFAPLAHIDEEEERAWALWFCERCMKLRDFAMTPAARVDVERALLALSTAPKEHRTLTNLLAQIQTHEQGLKEALSFYTLGSGGAILDGVATPTQEQSWRTYDMEKLLARGPEVSTPVLAHLFHNMGRLMDGRPTLALFDEGWMSASDALLRDYVEESSATNRKKVCSLGLVLHSPGNVTMFPRADLLLANIATLIFLPNDKAQDAALKPHYEALGLNGREIRMLAEEMQPQRDYYCVQGKHRRRFQLQSGPLEQAFLGVNGRDHKVRILALRHQYGERWPQAWLIEQGHAALAQQWAAWQDRRTSKSTEPVHVEQPTVTEGGNHAYA